MVPTQVAACRAWEGSPARTSTPVSPFPPSPSRFHPQGAHHRLRDHTAPSAHRMLSGCHPTLTPSVTQNLPSGPQIFCEI